MNGHTTPIGNAMPHCRLTAGLRPVLVAASLLLGACGPDHLGIDTSSGHSPDAIVNKVQWSEFSHSVRFARGRSRMSPVAARDLERFLSGQRIGVPDRVVVVSQPDLANKKQDHLAAKRELAVQAYLNKRRLRPELRSEGVAGREANSGGKDTVLVVVRRPLVSTPHCPDWGRIQRGEEVEGRVAEFGCMSSSALGAMVADPNDLVEGREMDAIDGAVAGEAVRRYRTGKVKSAKSQSTKSGK